MSSGDLVEKYKDWKNIDGLRNLCIDMVNGANSGHLGAPLGMAPYLYILWDRFLRFSPDNPNWFNRDRFILSNGHASSLLYALLHSYGFDLKMTDLMKFRQFGSRTPGHPEMGITPGVEVSTGPLGQGIANGVGMAIGLKHMGERFNKSGYPLITANVFVSCGDGCLMEGVAQEACSLAGTLGLSNLVLLYDDNGITIDGKTDIAFTEDIPKKFESLGWRVIICENANDNLDEIEICIKNAIEEDSNPTIICFKTTIGKTSNKEGLPVIHGSPLDNEDLILWKKKHGYITKANYTLSVECEKYFVEKRVKKGEEEKKWLDNINFYRVKYPLLYDKLWKLINKTYKYEMKSLSCLDKTDLNDKKATRVLSGELLNKIAKDMDFLVVGSADLEGSTGTKLNTDTEFDKNRNSVIKRDDFSGRVIRYGVREHGMFGIANGLSTLGILPIVSTFAVFVGYGMGAIRLSALSGHQVIYILTHDSIEVGEDGPTHQPVEVLTQLRAIPNLQVIRPCDGSEVEGAYRAALGKKDGPTAIVLTRQNVNTCVRTTPFGVEKGGYIVYENEDCLEKFKYDVRSNKKYSVQPIILIATGAEVQKCIEIAKNIKIPIRVVSMPSTQIFDLQSNGYKEYILPKYTLKIAIEAGSTLGWYKYADKVIGIDKFGASGKADRLIEEYGFSTEALTNKIIEFVRAMGTWVIS